MHENYIDILERIPEDPTWWDSNGTPRFGKFDPQRCPNIYANTVWLYRIACQSCGQEFDVEGHEHWWYTDKAEPRHSHYGDPPIHGCAGDTMNCDDLAVLEVWHKDRVSWEWVRRPEFEGRMDEGWNEGEKTSEKNWRDD